ncbi:MAG TPA: TPM domain-containing protein [Thermoanaerobaculia bacterium]|nr:TPM domain-containing protein [Thermoanaerobaculia bacterium]
MTIRSIQSAAARYRAAVLLLAAWGLSGPTAVVALEVPFLAGRVNDLAGMLDASAEARLEQKLAALERDTGSQVAVLTVPSLEGDSLEDFSIRVVETWKLGREGVDDGVLLLVARDERQLRLEVGYGLEGALPDALARRIVDNLVTARFREGDFAGGIETGIDAVLLVIRGEELPPALSVDPSANDGKKLLIYFGVIGYFALVVYRRYRRLRSGAPLHGWSSRGGGLPSGGWSSGSSSWSGGSGGSSFGGGFSGGGGSFGGGGASGRW